MATTAARSSQTSGWALRAVLVVALWAPANAAILGAIGWLARVTHPAPLAVAWFVASACALHACVWRVYREATLLTEVTLSPWAARLLWAAVLLLPVAGPVACVLSCFRAPPPTSDANRDDTRSASGA